MIMACRNLEKAEEAKVDIEKVCKDIPDTGHLVLAKCDLSSMKSIREFAQNMLDNEPQVNIINWKTMCWNIFFLFFLYIYIFRFLL